MSKLKPYPTYNPVQYDYVSQLPDGWQLLPNIAIFRERIERRHENEELLSVTIGKGVIKQSELEKKDSSTLDKSKYLLIYPGDLVYSMRFRQGASGYSIYKGIVSPACTVLKPKKEIEINPRFFFYMFRTGFYKNYVERFAYDIADGQIPLRYVDFKRMYSIVPPLETQNAIVAYLDRKTQQIQEFIAKKERLIELLEEQVKKTILELLISLNSQEISLKYCCSVIDCKHVTPNYVSIGIPVVSPGELKPYTINTNGSRSVTTKDYNVLCEGSRKPLNGDILYSRNASVGSAALVKENSEFCMGQDVCLIRSNKFHPEYLEHLLNSHFVVNQVEQTLIGSTIRRINISEIKVLKIICPDITIQKSICESITMKSSSLKLAINRADEEVRKAKEYQESLITQVVTGQLKVPCNWDVTKRQNQYAKTL